MRGERTLSPDNLCKRPLSPTVVCSSHGHVGVVPKRHAQSGKQVSRQSRPCRSVAGACQSASSCATRISMPSSVFLSFVRGRQKQTGRNAPFLVVLDSERDVNDTSSSCKRLFDPKPASVCL